MRLPADRHRGRQEELRVGALNDGLPTFGECFRFPLSSKEARADLVTGALLLFLGIFGWIFNLGHRLEVVHRLFHDEPPYFRGFRPLGHTFFRGLQAFCAISLYLFPAALTATLALRFDLHVLWPLCGALFVVAVYSLPGGMTFNAAKRDISYLYRPDRAFSRAVQGGRGYLKAWGIALSAVALSFLGLLALGVGFLFTSVWAWSVVGYAFSRALSLSDRAHNH